jgi:hypothetical protein
MFGNHWFGREELPASRTRDQGESIQDGMFVIPNGSPVIPGLDRLLIFGCEEDYPPIQKCAHFHLALTPFVIHRICPRMEPLFMNYKILHQQENQYPTGHQYNSRFRS